MTTSSTAMPATSRWFKQVEESKASFHAHETAACLEQIGLPHKFIIQEPETLLQRIGKKFASWESLQLRNSLSKCPMHDEKCARSTDL